MADVYFGFGGNDTTGDGSKLTPYLTYNVAQSNSSLGDTAIMVDGVLDSAVANDYINISANRNLRAENYRKAIFTPDPGADFYSVRFGNAIVAAGNPYMIDGLIIDSKNEVSRSLTVSSNTQSIDFIFKNCIFKNGSLETAILSLASGSMRIIGCSFEGSPSKLLINIPESSGLGDQVIDISGIELNADTSSSTFYGLKITKVNNTINNLDVNIKNVTGLVSGISGAGRILSFIYIEGVDSPKVVGCNFKLATDFSTLTSRGVTVLGRSLAPTNNAEISNNVITFNSPSGYALSLGMLLNTSIHTGKIAGNTVTGKFYSPGFPHNISLVEAVASEVSANVSIVSYIGYLIERVTNSNVFGNIAVDIYGASYYLKGVVSCDVHDNIAVITGNLPQIDFGIISIDDSDGVNTISATVSNNVILVATTNIHSLAQIADAFQVCTFSENLYVVPDTVDVSAELLFCYKSGAANNTLAQWNAQTEITNDRIVQMPVSAINELIRANTTSGGISSGGPLTLKRLSLS